MQIDHDQRTVMTLDAGGTNFVFSAIRANQEIVKPIILPSQAARSVIVFGQYRGRFFSGAKGAGGKTGGD